MRSLRLGREKWLLYRAEHPSEKGRGASRYRSFHQYARDNEGADSRTLENISAQREAFGLAYEVLDRLHFVVLTSRGREISEIKALLQHTDNLLQISRDLQTWLHNYFDSYSDALPREYYWEAVKAIEPLLEKHPALIKTLPELAPLAGEETVTKVRHAECGGFFHALGKSKAHGAKMYYLCDRCGRGYWAWIS